MLKPIVPKDYHMFLTETGRQRVLQVLFNFPDKEFSLSDLAKESGVSKTNIGGVLKYLQDKDVIEITKLTKIWRIRAKKSWNFIRAKTIYNLNFVYQSGLVEIIYDHFNHPRSVVLFGSFRRGEDASDSDIDIAVELDDGECRVVRLDGLSEFERSVGRRIQIHLFSRKTVDINLFNNIANGIVLTGFLEVKP